ncbi:MAG: phosphate signaling complex protein PhoU [Alphaproteobacteria bacterium]|nr:phosphate signaling complex protein PhoU [Alphaproteobacteria bacterium]
MPTHSVKSFDEQLNRLRDSLVRMGGLVESQIAAAIQALMRRDPDLALATVEGDKRVDEMERMIDELAVQMLALRQPVATDLRLIVASIRMAADLERMADYAKNVAKRSIALAQMAPVQPAHAIPRMGRTVQEMVKEVLDAFVHRDVAKAVAVWSRDEELDAMHSSLFRELITYMMEDPRNITPSTHLLFIAKNIERIGDHATNIAEMVHYQVTGRPLVDVRPKSDEASLAVVTPDKKAEP